MEMKVLGKLGSLSAIDIRGLPPRGAAIEDSLDGVGIVEVEGNWFVKLGGSDFESALKGVGEGS